MNSVQILDRLIGFATVSRDSNLALIEYVRDFLSDCGITARLYLNADGRKANLYASTGPTDRGGVLLSGHTDVVPVDGQRWTSDPFHMVEREGRLFARGAADMKGFLACALRVARRASERKLHTPLHLAFSYDEEIGCVGVRSLIEDMATWTHRPQFCIVGEPTLLRPAIGHKGKTAMSATCRGHAAHSASPGRGVNSIYMAGELIGKIRERQGQIERSGGRDADYEFPYTTLHVGTIRGGTVLNIVPSRCELELEIRNLPADDPDAIVAGMRADAAAIVRSYTETAPGLNAGLDIEVTNTYPALDTPSDAAVVALAAALTGQQERIKVGFGSEGGLFSQRLGIATVVCGPGSIDQAHKPDEYIERDQLDRCDAMMDALLQRLGG